MAGAPPPPSNPSRSTSKRPYRRSRLSSNAVEKLLNHSRSSASGTGSATRAGIQGARCASLASLMGSIGADRNNDMMSADQHPISVHQLERARYLEASREQPDSGGELRLGDFVRRVAVIIA